MATKVQVRAVSSFASDAAKFKPAAYKGWSREEHLRVRQRNVSPAMTPMYADPPLFTHGHMQYMYDASGKRYLDMFGGVCTVSVGHNHPKVSEAVKSQMDKIWHTTHLYMTPPVQEYAKKLTDKLPDHLSVCFFTNSGSEANDMALMLARMHTGNHDVISLRNGYHGLMASIVGLSGMSTWVHKVTATNLHQTLNPDPYRGLFGGKNCRDSLVQADRKCECAGGRCDASEKYAEQFQDLLDCSVPQKGVAAVIIEGIQGGGGIVQFPKGWVKTVSGKIQSQGGLYIADEVQTGFGRTGGHFWGFEMHDARPDIVTMAKSTGNGFPLACVVTTPEIAACLARATFFNTFGGNPLSCTAGSAVLDVIDEEGLQKNCVDVGGHLIKELAKLRDELPVVGDVRGKGLMVGVEMVENKETRKHLSAEKLARIHEATRSSGLLIGRGGLHRSVFRLQPPMCVTKENADFTVDVLRKAIKTTL